MALFKIKSVISSKDQDLLEAAKSGDVEAIVKITSKKRQSTASQVFTSFLKGSININCVDREGYTPLHLATLNGHKSAVECLLTLDASVSSKDNSGCTPLHLAAWKGYHEICTLFLTFTNATIPIDVQNSLGDTALHMAAQYGYKDVVDVLLQYNVDATIRNLKDQSALDLAAQYGRHDVVQLLVTKNPDLVKHTVTSHSPLHLAASCGHVQIISTLLEAGYDINTTTTGGTALHIAAMYCKTEVVKLLVEKGQSCILGYNPCSGSNWCCPDGYVCTGSSTCLSIGAIVGACIGAIVGLVFFIVLIYLCCRSKKGTVGTVITHPGAHTTVVGQQQYGQQAYGQPPVYGQPQ